MTFSIGVDVGGTKILAGLVDNSGAVVSTARRPTPRNDASEVLNVVAEVVRELVAPHEGLVVGVGLGVAGPVDASRATVFFAPNLGWSQVPVRAILESKVGMPVVVENGRKRFRACEGGSGSGSKIVGLDWVMLHSLVFPATNFGLNSDAASLAMIREEMKLWDDKVWVSHGNNFQTALIGAARVGFDPDFLVAKAKEVIAHRSTPNLWIMAGGGGIETCSGIPGLINEMMLQSHGGVMRIFPVFPSGQSGSFHRLRTFGAFLVSGAINKGVVQPIVIESEKGRPCVLQNPWPGKKVIISSKQGQTREISGDVLRLPTVDGERLTLTPQG